MTTKRNSLLSNAVLLFAFAAPLQVNGQFPTGPLATDFPIFETAAVKARDAYTLPNDHPMISVATNEDGDVKAGMLFEALPDSCWIAFSGRSMGFEWIEDIDLRLNYMSVKDRKKKRCRVVKHYKTLYTNKNLDGYKDDLDQIISSECADKTVVFSGFDLGGAMATLAALEYAGLDDMWAITFGSPPVFMPPKYVNPGRLVGRPSRKHPCKPIQEDRFVPITNSELVGPPDDPSQQSLFYDFMPFLNILLYELGNTDVAVPCMEEAAQNVADFLADPDTRGNLGSAFGQGYLFAPADALNAIAIRYLNFDALERVTFENQGVQGVVVDHLLSPPLLDAATCDFPTFPIHDMETYLAKVLSYNPENPPGHFDFGFAAFSPCNVNTDCQSKNCGGTVPGLCASAGARPPNMDMQVPMK